MKKVILGLIAFVFLTACEKKVEEDPIPSSFASIATVENPTKNATFYFRMDNNDRMWITKTNFPGYIPKDGQRIVANYSILSVNNADNTYNHKVYLNDVYEILTKGIYNIKPSTQDSIGNNPLEIRTIWTGSYYLNFEFVYGGYSQVHFINLVADAAKTYTDGKVHLEFRHNANDDVASYAKWGMASFDLRPLQIAAVGDSVNLVIHTKEFTTPADKTYNITYKFGSAAHAPALKRISAQRNFEPIF